MNEQLIASKIRQTLDQSVESLPYRITQRLENARERALARAVQTQRATSPTLSGVGGAAAFGARGWFAGGGRWGRLALAALPPLMIAACLYGVSVWNDATNAEEIAALDAEVLTDEVPIATLSDRGFGVYLHNTSYHK
jgi:transposase